MLGLASKNAFRYIVDTSLKDNLKIAGYAVISISGLGMFISGLAAGYVMSFKEKDYNPVYIREDVVRAELSNISEGANNKAMTLSAVLLIITLIFVMGSLAAIC